MSKQKRVLSGMRPTGKLHLGHHLGAIANWLKLQDNPEYDCYFMIADWHALSTAFMNTENLKQHTRDVILDYMASGLDPEKVTFYIQSHLPAIAELHILYSMITPNSWLLRVPTYKGQIQELGEEIDSYGFLGYPLLQTADITIVRAELVPVGQDQLPHLELAREVVRRFHYLYKKEIFPEPQGLLTESPMVPGTDGRKMSKSYDNAFYLSEPLPDIKKKLGKMFTDPQKIYKGDPGHPEQCPVHYFHKSYRREEAANFAAECKTGALGCVACKGKVFETLSEVLQPLQEKRAELAQKPGYVEEVLAEGAKKANRVAEETLKLAKLAMKIA